MLLIYWVLPSALNAEKCKTIQEAKPCENIEAESCIVTAEKIIVKIDNCLIMNLASNLSYIILSICAIVLWVL